MTKANLSLLLKTSKKVSKHWGFLEFLKTLKKVSKHWGFLDFEDLTKKIVKMSATKLSLSTTKTKHIKVKHPKRKLYRLIIFRVSLLYTDHFIKEFEQTLYMTVKESFCQTVRCSSKKCAKSLSWAENLNFSTIKYYSPINRHGKTFVYYFCILWITA